MRYILYIGLLSYSTIFGQHSSSQNDTITEIKSLKDFFLKGNTHGHFRNFFMTTINKDALNDYWTNATGGAIHYESATWNNFQIGVKGILTFKTFSSDLNAVDSLANSTAKWEKELYDISRPFEYKDLDRLEEFYISYAKESCHFTLGKLDLNKGPLLLRRDGRMKPFVYRGVWGQFKINETQKLEVGFLDKLSPRGMTEWYTLNDAIGLIDANPGENAIDHYHQTSKTRGLGVVGYVLENQILKSQFWNYALDRIMNTSWIKVDASLKNYFFGIQMANQFGYKNQSVLANENRYFQPNEASYVVSSQVGLNFTKIELGIAHLYSHSNGKFLFPKEMGRENFYVSQPYSWVNGLGNLNVFQLRSTFQSTSSKWKFDYRLSYWNAPQRSNYKNNKYKVGDYVQSTFQLAFLPSNHWDGLEVLLNYIARWSPDRNTSLESQFYKTNLHHVDLVMNINF